MANNKNLKPFKKGTDERRNLEGRPPKLPELDKLLAEQIGDEGLEKILKAVYQKALKGDTRAAEIILNRAYGQAKQYIEKSVRKETMVFKIAGQEIPFQKIKQ